MRKEIITAGAGAAPREDEDEWLDLERVARVELTSEEAAHPIESALAPGTGPGWRAAGPGEQVVRVVFDEPRAVRRVRLEFEERDESRTQEFVLRWSGEECGPANDVVRQRWNFHPPDGTTEVEDYRPGLAGVRVLEIAVTPDVSGGPARASMKSLRIA